MTQPFAPRDILFATDLSEISHGAGVVAAGVARQFHARLHVVHVAPSPTDAAQPPEALWAAVEELGQGLAVTVETTSGPAAPAILQYARREGIDLIVLGTHGRTGFSRALLGSVAEAVTRTAPCPVLAVPPRQPARFGSTLPRVPIPHCIVCAEASPHLVCEECRARIRDLALLAGDRPGCSAS